jgi:hypothetical protein
LRVKREFALVAWGRLLACQLERLGQTGAARARNTTFKDEAIELGSHRRRWPELRHRPVPVSDDQPLPASHTSQITTEILAQLADAHGVHVHESSM